MEASALSGRPAASFAADAVGAREPSAATLFVSYSGIYGGGERILVDLATRLRRLDPILACPEGGLAEAARERGLRVFPLTRRRLELRARLRDRVETPLRFAFQAGEIHELARALRPPVLVGWGARAAVECAAVARRLEPAPAVVFQNNDLLRGPIILRVARIAARRADLVVSLSAAIAGALDPDGVLDERSAVVPAGVDVDAFADVPPAADRPHALLLGAIVGWKRPRLALEAVALAARELPALTLTVAGPAIDGAGERLLEALRRRAAEPDLAGRVRFAGGLADPRPALAEASCLLHCADSEPYGLVLVEALAAGRPVVAPASGGPLEVVPPDCGRLYVPGDPRSAAEALVGLLATPGLPRRVGEAGRRRAERHYRVEDSSRRFGELVEHAAARRRPPPAEPARRPGEGMALVTVLHDSEREVSAFVHSANRHLSGARVVAVDSGSTDGGADMVRRLAPGAAVVVLDRNVGFGAACNAAMAEVTEPVTVLVNPDVELLDASLGELAVEALRGDRPERLLAPLVLHPAGRREDSAHNAPGAPAELARAVVPAPVLPRRARVAVEPWRSDGPRRVGWAVGACLVARTETLRRLGPFEASAFMYAEDLDLCLRAADRGIATWFWPSARVLHHRAHASARVFGGEPYDLLATRRREVVGRRRGRARQSLDDGFQLVMFANRMALKRLLGRTAAREREQVRALLRARRAGHGGAEQQQ